MSTVFRNRRTFQNRNRLVTKAEERLHGPMRSQQRELVYQQNLILMQQARQLKQSKQPDVTQPLPSVQPSEKHFVQPSEKHSVQPSTSLSLQNGHEQTTTATIFVSIASYRDPEVVATILDLFDKADHPHCVYVGLYEQNDPVTDAAFTLSKLVTDESSTHQLAPYYQNDQLRIMCSPCVEAKGPMYARAMIEQLYGGEQYFMIIDSHSMFVSGWDTKCLSDMAKLPPQSVLSYFPPSFEPGQRQQTPLEKNPALKLDYLRLLKFDKNSGFPMPTKQSYKNMPRVPIPALFWTACFSFAPASMLKKVPFDPSFPYLFLGEEISINLRLYTHGFNVYTPSQHILFHIENRDYRPTFWELFHDSKPPKNASFQVTAEERDERKKLHQGSIQRMVGFLSGRTNPEMGTVRSHSDFWEYVGIDFVNQQAKEHATYGRTQRPSREEQYAKMTENASQVTTPAPLKRNSHDANPRGSQTSGLRGKMLGGAMKDAAPQHLMVQQSQTRRPQMSRPWLRQTQTQKMTPVNNFGRRR